MRIIIKNALEPIALAEAKMHLVNEVNRDMGKSKKIKVGQTFGSTKNNDKVSAFNVNNSDGKDLITLLSNSSTNKGSVINYYSLMLLKTIYLCSE